MPDQTYLDESPSVNNPVGFKIPLVSPNGAAQTLAATNQALASVTTGVRLRNSGLFLKLRNN